MQRSTCRAYKRGFMWFAQCFGILCLTPVRRWALPGEASCVGVCRQGRALRRNNVATRQIERLLTNVAVLKNKKDVAHRHGVFLHKEMGKSVMRHLFSPGKNQYRRVLPLSVVS